MAQPHKSNRSAFYRIISSLTPCNHLRMARLDFWGAVVLVCLLGAIVKLIQYLLAIT